MLKITKPQEDAIKRYYAPHLRMGIKEEEKDNTK